MIRIALDAMGGDHAPHEVVKGAVAALREQQVELVLVGQGDIMRRELEKHGRDSKISLVEASEVVTMGENPVSAISQKGGSSIVVGMNLLKSEQVSAFVSAGNTGAIMTAALLTLGTQEGVARPALSIALPTPSGPVLFLDVGANADCRATHLLCFAQMGSDYMNRVFGIQTPRVGLLSIGEEESKGNKLVREAHQLLKESELNFIGNVESKDIHKGIADVVVTDGFTGNVVVKLTEGLGALFLDLARRRLNSSLRHRLISPLLKPALRAVERQLMDYSGSGVALLLGVRGNVIKAHGRSKAEGIKRAIAVAKKVAEQGTLEVFGGT
jgi:glycerol-3-phosphate acyltransferase PlsX